MRRRPSWPWPPWRSRASRSAPAAPATPATTSAAAPAAGAIKTGPGVDAATKTIRIGDLNALSGPAAALGKPVAAGHQAFFDALNARGGIDGWKVELAVEDTGYQPQQHVQALQRSSRATSRS